MYKLTYNNKTTKTKQKLILNEKKSKTKKNQIEKIENKTCNKVNIPSYNQSS